LQSGGFDAEGLQMNFKPINHPKTFFALALILTISLMACTQLSQVNAQTSDTISINSGATYTNTTAVTLTLSATNATEMCFSSDNATWSNWETYGTVKNWTIADVEGTQTVYTQFQDSANQTSFASAEIILDVTPPTVDPYWELYSTNTVFFDARYSTDNFGIQNATWDLGDGNVTSNYSYFTHTYASPGSYVVNLTLTDYAGNSASVVLNVTVPDLSNTATPTPAPTVTVQPTVNPTQQPTDQPSATAAPFELDSLTMIVLLGAIGIIAVVIFAIILVLRKKPKAQPPKPAEQSPPPTQPPKQQPQPSTPSGPAESNFTI
jgi:PKD repeat protein